MLLTELFHHHDDGCPSAVTTGSGGVALCQVKYWNGSAWVAAPIKRWNGCKWVYYAVKHWNGTSWV